LEIITGFDIAYDLREFVVRSNKPGADMFKFALALDSSTDPSVSI
jgi:hypothetical protein